MRRFKAEGVRARSSLKGSPTQRLSAPLRSALAVRRGLELALRELDDLREGGVVVHSEVGEHAAVEVDVSELEAVHKAAVVQLMGANRSVDADDPEAAEGALALLAVAVRVAKATVNSLDRAAEELAVSAAVALGELEDAVVTTAGFKPSFYSWHLICSCGVARPARSL